MRGGILFTSTVRERHQNNGRATPGWHLAAWLVLSGFILAGAATAAAEGQPAPENPVAGDDLEGPLPAPPTGPGVATPGPVFDFGELGFGLAVDRCVFDDPASPPGDDRPGTAPTTTILITAGASPLPPGQRVKLIDPGLRNPKLAMTDEAKEDTGFDMDPHQCTADDEGGCRIEIPKSYLAALMTGDDLADSPAPAIPDVIEIAVGANKIESYNVAVPNGGPGLPEELADTADSRIIIGDTTHYTFNFGLGAGSRFVDDLRLKYDLDFDLEENRCRRSPAAPPPGSGAKISPAAAAAGIAPPDDPYYAGTVSRRRDYDDQWAIKRVGLTAGGDSAWALVDADAEPVVVAVIDSGLDWNHRDISWNNIWINPGEEPDNGVDDDGNGFVDDIIGWNFDGNNNKPWDHDGHGTFVTGVIAAAWGNKAGLAGINPKARIMVLKALDDFGNGRAAGLAAALVYAADNGARVINMSVGGKGLTRIEREAVAYAYSRGAVIVVAAGNGDTDVADFGIAGLDEVIAVAATDFNDRRARYSNWGKAIDIAAPGLDVLGPRARRTDLMLAIPGVEYIARGAYVGDDKRYYKASGTAFSAAIVSAIASLVVVARPELTNVEVRRIVLNSARDIATPGIDSLTGHGLVDARAALAADKEFFIETVISGTRTVQIDDRLKVEVIGTVDADNLGRAWIEIGPGEDPVEWKKVVADFREAVREGVLGRIDTARFGGAAVWTLRLRAEHRDGRTREARYLLSLE